MCGEGPLHTNSLNSKEMRFHHFHALLSVSGSPIDRQRWTTTAGWWSGWRRSTSPGESPSPRSGARTGDGRPAGERNEVDSRGQRELESSPSVLWFLERDLAWFFVLAIQKGRDCSRLLHLRNQATYPSVTDLSTPFEPSLRSESMHVRFHTSGPLVQAPWSRSFQEALDGLGGLGGNLASILQGSWGVAPRDRSGDGCRRRSERV